ncbi:MAG: metallophosphoesterase [Candidatus Diapherotrites archaeon]|nr:metallophosphoesterase [Candidatus Diapherotrites archaeon]
MSERLKIFNGAKIEGLGLFIEPEKMLIVADLHLGIEEMYNRQGIMVPRTNYAEIKKNLCWMIERTKPKKIVINGDIKHEFGEISKQEWREVLSIIDFISTNVKELVLIKGNHDKILGPLAELKGLRILDELYIKGESLLITHGHEISNSNEYEKAKTLIIAHEHPAVSVREGMRSELYKCFLKGNFLGKKLIVMPSMNSIAIGSNVLREKTLSPYLQQDLGKFECWAIEDKPYYFGKLGALNE